jgi:hypothetical protein
MLIPETFTSVKLDGDPVVFVPGAERIYVVGSRDQGAIEAAMALVDARLERPRGLCRFAFVLQDGKWTLFAPPGPLGRELGGRLALHLADAYAEQREELQARYEDDEDAPFIPNVMGIGTDDGQLHMTLSTWTDGVRAFLPRTHLVTLGRLETGEMATVTWEDVMELASDCLEPVPDLYPPRWETKSFPKAAVYAKLRARDTMKGSESPEEARKAELRRKEAAAAMIAKLGSPTEDVPEGPAPRNHLRLIVVGAVLLPIVLWILYTIAR